MVRKTLLWCGIASSVLYVCMDRIAAAQYPGYDSASQTISELSAIGAPTRALWVLPGAAYTALVCAFGYGVWLSARGRRALRIAGALLLIYGALGLLWPFAPMHQREVIAAGQGGLTDTMHVALAAVTVPLMLAAIAAAALALGRTFRLYCFATLFVVLVTGVLTFLSAPSLEAGVPTPLIGVWERISVGAFLLWVIVLAGQLLPLAPYIAAERPRLAPTTR